MSTGPTSRYFRRRPPLALEVWHEREDGSDAVMTLEWRAHGMAESPELTVYATFAGVDLADRHLFDPLLDELGKAAGSNEPAPAAVTEILVLHGYRFDQERTPLSDMLKTIRLPADSAAICGALIAWIEDAPTDGESTDLVRMAAPDIARLANKIAAALPAHEPSPDLKEAISAALRGYVTVYPTIATEAASDLDEVFGEDNIQAQAELDQLADHLAEAVAPAPPLALTEDDLAERTHAIIRAWLSEPGSLGEAGWARILAHRIAAALGRDDSEETGAAAFDPHDPEAVCDLGARITNVEAHLREVSGIVRESGLALVSGRLDGLDAEIAAHQDAIRALQEWRRSCAHLPADAGALAALVDAAVERDMEPRLGQVRQMLDSSHQTAIASIEAVEARVLALETAPQSGGAALAAKATEPARLLEIYYQVTGDQEGMGADRVADVVRVMRAVIAAPDCDAAGQVLMDANWAATHHGRPGLLYGWAKRIRELAGSAS